MKSEELIHFTQCPKLGKGRLGADSRVGTEVSRLQYWQIGPFTSAHTLKTTEGGGKIVRTP